MKKFAKPEDVEKYQKNEKLEEECEKDEDEDEDKKEEEMSDSISIEDLQARIAQLEKDIEDRDNIIMGKDEEIKALKEFKDDVEKKEKATVVESLISEVAEFLDEETMKTLRSEGLSCDMCDMDGWKNKVKAMCFSAIKKQPVKKHSDVWSFSSPIDNQNEKKSDSVWDRI